MRAGRYSIIVGILVLIAGLVKGSHLHAPQVRHLNHSDITVLRDVRHHQQRVERLVPVILQGEPSDRTRHKEKRHGKSLVSQDIVANGPIVIYPDFTYCYRNYSLFLPGGCTRQFIGNFSLRGPPAC